MSNIIDDIMAIINKNMHIEYTNDYVPKRVLTDADLYKVRRDLAKLLNSR